MTGEPGDHTTLVTTDLYSSCAYRTNKHLVSWCERNSVCWITRADTELMCWTGWCLGLVMDYETARDLVVGMLVTWSQEAVFAPICWGVHSKTCYRERHLFI